MQPQYNLYIKQLIETCGENGYWLKNLGSVGDKPVWFIRTDDTINRLPNLLIVAGFHGEEKAGPWGLLKWLELNREVEANISCIPIVNPTGFNLGKRYNTWGQKSNGGFYHTKKGEDPSEEGKILIANRGLIIDSSTGGTLSLHEDITASDYYVYTFEKAKEPGKFTCGLLETLGKHFNKPLNGVTVSTDSEDPGPYIVNGVVYKHCDGSFEDWLFHEGSVRTAVTETPAYRIRLQRRISATVDIIDKFIELCIEGV